jgi:uncharacterized protein YdeI (YjbR/CyaY-like superfamily)
LSDEPVVELERRGDWRMWLRDNHKDSTGVWLVTPKKASGRPHVSYDEAVEEALCFGWVDSKSRSVDDERTSLWFTPRKAKSAWSASNVARVERLERAGQMRAAGRKAVAQAKANGRWPA